MELELHSINGMRNMEVIDVLTGSKLGFIRDLKIDCDTNKVISLILPGEVKSWFGKERNTVEKYSKNRGRCYTGEITR